jgi:hypothetical protein
MGARDQEQEDNDEEEDDDAEEDDEVKREVSIRKKGLHCVAEAALGLGEMAAGTVTW